jgi:hypothetical protein
MSKAIEPIHMKLENGTVIRHKVVGYEGRIDGTTEIKACFTKAGHGLDKLNSKETFQYRVMVEGEALRRIAPAEDFEILEGVVDVICPSCRHSFHSKPGIGNKPGGRCQCGGWICPSCLSCQEPKPETAGSRSHSCLKQRDRKARKIAAEKRSKAG